MQETPQEYIRRVVGYLEGQEPLAVLKAAPGELERAVRGLSPERMARRPAPEAWSITEVLAHLADTELVYGYRIRLILEGGGPPIQGIDQDAWARSGDYAGQDPALSLEAFRVTRERLVRLLERMPRECWEWHGLHSERGRETVARVVEMLAGHDLAHLRQIRGT
ncbi:MAG: DinB family protein [Holophaga sp.]|jgi:hypothetical protein